MSSSDKTHLEETAQSYRCACVMEKRLKKAYEKIERKLFDPRNSAQKLQISEFSEALFNFGLKSSKDFKDKQQIYFDKLGIDDSTVKELSADWLDELNSQARGTQIKVFETNVGCFAIAKDYNKGYEYRQKSEEDKPGVKHTLESTQDFMVDDVLFGKIPLKQTVVEGLSQHIIDKAPELQKYIVVRPRFNEQSITNFDQLKNKLKDFQLQDQFDKDESTLNDYYLLNELPKKLFPIDPYEVDASETLAFQEYFEKLNGFSEDFIKFLKKKGLNTESARTRFQSSSQAEIPQSCIENFQSYLALRELYTKQQVALVEQFSDREQLEQALLKIVLSSDNKLNESFSARDENKNNQVRILDFKRISELIQTGAKKKFGTSENFEERLTKSYLNFVRLFVTNTVSFTRTVKEIEQIGEIDRIFDDPKCYKYLIQGYVRDRNDIDVLRKKLENGAKAFYSGGEKYNEKLKSTLKKLYYYAPDCAKAEIARRYMFDELNLNISEINKEFSQNNEVQNNSKSSNQKTYEQVKESFDKVRTAKLSNDQLTDDFPVIYAQPSKVKRRL